MELKTKIHAEDGRQDLRITREFELPLELLFKACSEPEIVEQWMGTKVLQFEGKKHGSYRFETKSPEGDVVFGANGVFHEFVPNQKITRTFEMENSPFDVQIEFHEFEKVNDAASRLTIHVVYRSGALRDQMLKLPFAQGINMAHNRLEAVVKKIKQ